MSTVYRGIDVTVPFKGHLDTPSIFHDMIYCSALFSGSPAEAKRPLTSGALKPKSNRRRASPRTSRRGVKDKENERYVWNKSRGRPPVHLPATRGR